MKGWLSFNDYQAPPCLLPVSQADEVAEIAKLSQPLLTAAPNEVPINTASLGITDQNAAALIHWTGLHLPQDHVISRQSSTSP